MRTWALAVLAAVVMMAATPAAADWQWSKWGMTPDQVVAASGGAAKLVSPAQAKAALNIAGAKCLAEIAEPGDIGGLAVQRITFCFDEANHLQSVELFMEEQAFGTAAQKLGAVYGQPVAGSEIGRTYRDSTHGNSVQLLRIGGTWIIYKPTPAGL